METIIGRAMDRSSLFMGMVPILLVITRSGCFPSPAAWDAVPFTAAFFFCFSLILTPLSNS